LVEVRYRFQILLHDHVLSAWLAFGDDLDVYAGGFVLCGEDGVGRRAVYDEDVVCAFL
jgi:hypothetical protein